jgi:hypothetical protein
MKTGMFFMRVRGPFPVCGIIPHYGQESIRNHRARIRQRHQEQENRTKTGLPETG